MEEERKELNQVKGRETGGGGETRQRKNPDGGKEKTGGRKEEEHGFEFVPKYSASSGINSDSLESLDASIPLQNNA